MGLFGRCRRLVNVPMSVSRVFNGLCGRTLANSTSYNKLVSCGCFSNRPMANLARKHPLFIHATDSGFGLTGFVHTRLCTSMNMLGVKGSVLFGRRGVGMSHVANRKNLFHAGNMNREILTTTVGSPVSIVRATKRNNT